jgi:hypothetical protein
MSFRPLHARDTLLRGEWRSTPSGPATFTVARRCGSSRLAAALAHSAKMPRSRFYNRRSRNEHPQKHHFWRPLFARRGKNPPALELRTLRTRRFRRAFEKTPDHLAVIQPPTVARLTAHNRLRVAWQPRLRLRANRGVEPPQLYRLADSLPRRASDTHRSLLESLLYAPSRGPPPPKCLRISTETSLASERPQ